MPLFLPGHLYLIIYVLYNAPTCFIDNFMKIVGLVISVVLILLIIYKLLILFLDNEMGSKKDIE